MCFPNEARPPAPPGAGSTASTRVVRLGPSYGELAVPTETTGDTAVLVLPDGRGLHDYYRALAVDFAGLGIPALALDFYGRTAAAPPRGPDFESRRHSALLRWANVQDDLAAGARLLREQCGAVCIVVVGFCLGGRIALLAATFRTIRPAGAVAFYAQTHGATRSDLPAPDELIAALTCPVLSVFGSDDELIPADEVRLWEERLHDAPVSSDVIVYRDAGHSFFDREATKHRTQCSDAWQRMLAFVEDADRLEVCP